MTSDALPEAPGASSFVGRTLDERYRLERVLGEGGMGAVFVAEHLRLEKRVAVKIILPAHAGNADLASRFAREAMVTAKLEHPHVVTALDSGTLPEGGAYLVMTLAPGRSLRQLIQTRPGWRLACEVGAQIADALAAAHAMGVVHRDLKPENVIVEERADGSVHARVLDFGIARAIDARTTAGGTPLTRVGTILGTPGYMPPEQALGDTADPSADLYSLGVVVWELASGKALFPQGELREIAVAQLTEPIPELPASDAPAALQTLLDELLMPKREDRPESTIAVRDTLRRTAQGAGAEVAPGDATPAAPSAAGAPIPATNEPVPDVAAGTPPTTGPRAAAALATPAPAARATSGSSALAAPAGTSRDGPSRGRLVRIAAGVAALACLLICGGLATRSCADEPAIAETSDGTAAAVAPPPEAPLTTGALGGDIPPELEADVRTLIESPDDLARAAAAPRVAAARGRVPAFAEHLADYELATECEGRRDAVRALRDDRDPRAVPALRRMQALPRTGCAPDGAGDCHRCMRRDVDRALDRLEDDEHEAEGPRAATRPRPTGATAAPASEAAATPATAGEVARPPESDDERPESDARDRDDDDDDDHGHGRGRERGHGHGRHD